MISATTWILTLVALVGLSLAEYLVSRRRRGGLSVRAASVWSLGYVATALVFGAVLGVTSGWELAGEYYAGYAVEKSLSIDNLFVFVVIVSSFAVPAAQQSRALSIGLGAALVLRGAFILAGAALLHAFTPSFAAFGAILIVTAVQLVRHRAQTTPSVVDGRLARRLRRALPVTARAEGGRLLARVDGRRAATPLLLAVLTMIGADALFALDSIPAIYGVTEHPYVVFAANAFALLGLRALFFVVAGLAARLRHLPLGMAAILGFIGVKLVLHAAHAEVAAIPTISTPTTLAVVLGMLAVATAASLLAERRARGRGHPEMGPGPHGRIEPAATR